MRCAWIGCPMRTRGRYCEPHANEMVADLEQRLKRSQAPAGYVVFPTAAERERQQPSRRRRCVACFRPASGTLCETCRAEAADFRVHQRMDMATWLLVRSFAAGRQA